MVYVIGAVAPVGPPAGPVGPVGPTGPVTAIQQLFGLQFLSLSIFLLLFHIDFQNSLYYPFLT